MKRYILLIIFSLIVSGANAGNWMTNLEQAKKLALTTDKLVLVDFWAIWCGPCKKMDMNAWSDPEIQQLMEAYVPVKVDIDREEKVRTQYNVRSIPYVFIIDGNGEIVYRSLGYMGKDEVKSVLQKYALSTNFLRQDAINYYQHQNYVTGLRLAEKYFDYSLHLNNDVKGDFLNLAKSYLKQSSRLLDKKQTNYKFVKEKTELLEMTAALYTGDEKTLQKFLNNTSLEDVSPKNRTLYAHISLCFTQKNGSRVEAENWKRILADSPGGELYLLKAQLFAGEKS